MILDTSHWATQGIKWSATGLYMAYPTTDERKPIFRGYKTMVNRNHTKVGITRDSFAQRQKEYLKTFDGEVEFIPLIEIPKDRLKESEDFVRSALTREFGCVGNAREWFNTDIDMQ